LKRLITVTETIFTKRLGEKFLHPTLADIARRAGVAPMTVSRVINGTGYVSAATRERVQPILEELDYRPNELARSLKRQHTQIIGILLPDIANPFSAELARGIQQVLLKNKYSAFIATTEQSVEREMAALSAFVDHRLDGIIVATMETKAGDDALRRCIKRGVPIVTVGRALSHLPADRVTCDDWRGGYEAVEHLISLGHKRIAFIGSSLLNAGRLRRFQGFVDALRESGLSVAEELVAGPKTDSGPAYSTYETGYQGMQRLLALTNRPSAAFARNDYTAFGAISAARDQGLSVPDDIAVVGFDNVPLGAYSTPPLTTIEQPTPELGRKAVSMLLERLNGQVSGEGREICFPCRLIVRESTCELRSQTAKSVLPHSKKNEKGLPRPGNSATRASEAFFQK
jgi:DNA-binding LacI/PurR family transcriptional regulator